jgi:hypothetical protein
MRELVARAVSELHRSSRAAIEPAIAPPHQRDEDPEEVAAGVGQHVLVARRVRLVADTVEESFGDEPAEALGEDVAADRQRGLDLVEAARAEEQLAEDEGRPPVAEEIDRPRDRARPGSEGGPAHSRENSPLHDTTH